MLNSSTSLYSGLAIFSVLGFMAHEQGVDVGQVAESGRHRQFFTNILIWPAIIKQCIKHFRNTSKSSPGKSGKSQ